MYLNCGVVVVWFLLMFDISNNTKTNQIENLSLVVMISVLHTLFEFPPSQALSMTYTLQSPQCFIILVGRH